MQYLRDSVLGYRPREAARQLGWHGDRFASLEIHHHARDFGVNDYFSLLPTDLVRQHIASTPAMQRARHDRQTVSKQTLATEIDVDIDHYGSEVELKHSLKRKAGAQIPIQATDTVV